MNPYFCTVKVLLKVPIRAKEESGRHHGFLTGYYRNVGVRAANISEVMKVLEATVEDGAINWEGTVVHDFERVEESITHKFFQNEGNAIWYTSGRIFFPPTMEDN